VQLARLHTKLPLSEPQLLGLVALYRGLALLPPTINLFWLEGVGSNRGLAGALFGLAGVNFLLQTALFFRFRQQFKKSGTTPGPDYILVLLIFELLVDAGLNSAGGVWSSPYYLYSLAAIFQSAFFFGLVGGLASALVLAVAYVAGLVATLVLTGRQNTWLLPVSELSGFFIGAALLGGLVVVSRRVRRQSVMLERYRQSLEYQTQSLEQANHRLDYLAYFSRALQEGNNVSRVEQLALQYLSRFLEESRGGVPDANSPAQKVRLLKGNEAQDWLNLTKTGTLQPVQQPGNEVITVWREGQRWWLLPLSYKGEQHGVLAVPATPRAYEAEEKQLLSLLGDQMARVLGSLKQNQALAVESERARLAMDMHDVVAQSLFGIALNLNACVKLLDKEPQTARQRLGDLQNLAFETLASVRNIIYDLWNQETDKTDFATLIQNYLKKAGRLYPFKINLEVKDNHPKDGFELEADVQKSLYRVLQESLANTAKHSGANEVWITLARSENQVELEVRDNGRGFDSRQLKASSKAKNEANSSVASGGMGLNTMGERLEQLGGRLVIESRIGKGTRLVATLPVRTTRTVSPEVRAS
jgi:signal transduction histidine kinase